MRKRISLVIKLFGEAQKALTDITSLFVLPFVTIFILLVFLIYWLMTAMMIYSFGEYNSDVFYIGNFNINKNILANVMWVYHIVGLIWISEFIFGCQAMVVSGSVAQWYFERYIKLNFIEIFNYNIL
jgi:solute carrier family 44 protein 1 (choline transporter-like protein)